MERTSGKLRELRAAGVRIAPHFYSKDEELETAIETIDEIVKEQTGVEKAAS